MGVEKKIKILQGVDGNLEYFQYFCGLFQHADKMHDGLKSVSLY